MEQGRPADQCVEAAVALYFAHVAAGKKTVGPTSSILVQNHSLGGTTWVLNDDGTRKRYSPELEKSMKEERLRHKQAEAELISAGKCLVSRVPTTVLRWTLGKDKSKILKIAVVDSALEELRNLTGHVSMVSIVGPYRSGKSFLLNQILAEVVDPSFMSQDASPRFQVGDTILPETEEVSMLVIPSCARAKSKDASDVGHLVLLDSPGLFAPNRAAIFDAQLLAILNLLSSVVVYNSRGIIDRSAMEKLSFAIDTATTMAYMNNHQSNLDSDSHSKSAGTSTALTGAGAGQGSPTKKDPISRPYLIWAVQDFHLEMAADTTDTTWITKVLRDIDTSNNGTAHMESQFKAFFLGNAAYTFPFPVAQVKDIPNLSKMPRSQHSPEYKAALQKFVPMLQVRATSKLISGASATGSMLANMIEKWTDSINVPIGNFMGNSAAALLDHIFFKEVGRLVNKYEKAMSVIRIPWTKEDIVALHDKTLVGLLGDLPQRLRGAIQEAINPHLEKYIKESAEYSHRIIVRTVAEYNMSVVRNFTHLAVTANDFVDPQVIEQLTNSSLFGLENAVRTELNLNNDARRIVVWAGWNESVEAFIESLHYQRGRIYRANGVREGVRVLHLCSEFLKKGELETLVKANVSTTKFEEDFDSFDKRCGNEARRKVKSFIFENQTAVRPLSNAVAHLVEEEAMLRIKRYVKIAHLRRQAILDFLQCVAIAGLPLENQTIDECGLKAVRFCRGPTGNALCTITAEIDDVSRLLGDVNLAESTDVCIKEGKAIVAGYESRIETWWLLDSSSSWYSLPRLKGLLDKEWTVGSHCRGPASRSDERNALVHRSYAVIEEISIKRLQTVEISLWVVYGVCIFGLLRCIFDLCERTPFQDAHRESKRQSKQMWCSCFMVSILFLALAVSLSLCVVAPFAVWRLQLSRQLPALNLKIDEPDDDSVSLLHMVLCNVLLVQVAFTCDQCCRARRLRAKAMNSKFTV